MIADTEWVLREPGSGTRSAFEAAVASLAPACATLRIALELPSNEAVRAAVEAGLGATALSASVAAPESRNRAPETGRSGASGARLHGHPASRALPERCRRRCQLLALMSA